MTRKDIGVKMKETPKPEKRKETSRKIKKNNDCKFQDVFRLPNLSGPRQDCKWILCFFCHPLIVQLQRSYAMNCSFLCFVLLHHHFRVS